jgi:cytochrome P450
VIPRSSQLSLQEITRVYNNDVIGYYAGLRSIAGSDALLWDEWLGGWLVLSYRLCCELGESRLLGYQMADIPNGARAEVNEFVRSIFRAQFVCQEPALSRERRSYWGSMLSNRLANQELRTIANTLIDRCQPDVDCPDLLRGLLDAFASRVACAALGITEEQRSRILPLVMSYARLMDGKLAGPADVDEALLSVAKLYNYLSVLIPPGSEPAEYGRHEWLSDLELMIVAGHVSVAYLLGTVFSQVQKPVSRSHAYLARLVAEGLRFDSPIQISAHLLQSGICVQGKQLCRGDKVFLHLGVANRDPIQFGQPDSFDASRSMRKPLSYGVTPESQCPGRGLANRSAIAFLTVLSERNEWLVLDRTRARWDNGLAGRGFRLLPGKLVRFPDPGDGITTF